MERAFEKIEGMIHQILKKPRKMSQKSPKISKQC